MARLNTYRLVGAKKRKHRANRQPTITIRKWDTGYGTKTMSRRKQPPSPYNTRAYRAARKRLHPLPCHYCGTTPAGTIDHVIPLMLGGTNTPGNLVPCCQTCNSRRGNAAYKAKQKRRERSPRW